MRHLLSVLIVAVLAGAGAGATGARAADLVYGVDATDPGACADERVLARIAKSFSYQVRHVPHLPDVEIVAYSGLGQKRYLPRTERHPIERRYCYGRVSLSDGQQRPFWYLIERPLGFAGIGSNVEACVLGFDRWLVYGGNCRVLR